MNLTSYGKGRESENVLGEGSESVTSWEMFQWETANVLNTPWSSQLVEHGRYISEKKMEARTTESNKEPKNWRVGTITKHTKQKPFPEQNFNRTLPIEERDYEITESNGLRTTAKRIENQRSKLQKVMANH